jgi:hypothetical protein
MGNSSFRIVTVAPNYLGTLVRALSIAWRGKSRPPKPNGRVDPPI